MDPLDQKVLKRDFLSWRKVYRWTELLVLFAGVPIAYALGFKGVPLFIVLSIAFVLCLTVLLFDKGYDKKELYRLRGVNWKLIVARFLVLAGITATMVYFFLPEEFLHLVYKDPKLLILILLLYPLWSAYPQEIIYRAFFFRRYSMLISNKHLLLLLNGVLFGIGHLVFENWVAIVATLFGGVMFALTYKKNKSVLASSIEHGLYGDLIYLIGIGSYFYKA